MADLKAMMMAIGSSIFKKIQWRFAGAYLKTPTIQDFAINKYGLDDYIQSNVELRYQADELLKNLSFDALFVYKKALSDQITDAQRFNKLNLYQINLVLNYRF